MSQAIVLSNIDMVARSVGEWLGINRGNTIESSLIRAVRLMVGPDVELERFPWANLGQSHLKMLTKKMSEEGYAVNTVNHTLSAIKSLMNHLWVGGLIDERTFLLVNRFRGVRGNASQTGRALTTEEQRQLLAAAPDVRVRAMIHLMLSGLRRIEVVRLNKDSVVPTKEGLDIRVLGKGNKWRVVPLRGRAAQEVLEHSRSVRGGALFRGHIFSQETGRISVRGVSKLFDTAAAAAGLEITTHDQRRTAATQLYLAGVSVGDIATFLGHSAVTTTIRYVKQLEEEAVRNTAADKLAAARGE